MVMSLPLQTMSKRPRRCWLGWGVLLIAAGAFGAWFFWFKWTTPHSPEVELTGVDPAVRRAVEEALTDVRRAPRDADAWGRLGMVLTSHIFEDAAMVCFAQAERLDPDNPRWPYFQGCIEQAHNRPTGLAKLRRAVGLCPARTEGPRLRLAEALWRSGEVEAARELFESLLQADDNHARAHLGLARIHLEANELSQCREHLERAQMQPRVCKAALTLAAEFYERQGDTVTAHRALASLISLPDDPDWPDEFLAEAGRCKVGESVRVQQAAKLLDQQRNSEALSRLEELVRDYPESARGWTLLGWAQMQMRQSSAAEQSLQIAIQLDPEDCRARLYLGTIRHQRKDRAGAMALFREAIARKPNYLEAHFNLGACLQEEGDRPAAITAFRAAIRCQPLSAAAHARLGELLLGENPEEGRSHLQQAIDLDPNERRARELLATLRP
jgi:cytochrome c-type biogenesis protein CcmH/NrfG